jgi:ATPase subunit of ABC transporter with duplicated ATPase domains
LLQKNTLPEERVLYLPQEISAKQSAAILLEVKNVRPAELGRLMQIVSRLGSRPERILESELPSPGEVRKLLIALGIQKNPHLIVMDEPTNHLDLPSIECLQTALQDCPCALLMVSHDQAFLEALTSINWVIQSREEPILEAIS